MNEKIIPDQFLDLRGIACPNNFVRAKLKLEDMRAGEILHIVIDDGEPIKNVPRALKEEGHQILSVISIDDHWELLIRKP